MDEKKITLEDVRDKCLKKAYESGDPDEAKKALRDGLECEDRIIQKSKIEVDKDKQRKDRILKMIEIGVPIVLTGVNLAAYAHFYKKTCLFEKDYTFTTSAGKQLSGGLSRFLFRK